MKITNKMVAFPPTVVCPHDFMTYNRQNKRCEGIDNSKWDEELYSKVYCPPNFYVKKNQCVQSTFSLIDESQSESDCNYVIGDVCYLQHIHSRKPIAKTKMRKIFKSVTYSNPTFTCDFIADSRMISINDLRLYDTVETFFIEGGNFDEVCLMAIHEDINVSLNVQNSRRNKFSSTKKK